MMKASIVIVGEGVLADYVSAELAGAAELVRLSPDRLHAELPEAARLALLLYDGWRPDVAAQAEEQLRAAQIPSLRAAASFGEGVVGPLVVPGEPGCVHCADSRRLIAGRERKSMRLLQLKLAGQGGTQRDLWATRPALLHMAKLVAAEARRALLPADGERRGKMYLVNLMTLATSSHCILPDSLCPVCSRPEEDSPELARLVLSSSPKLHANSYRTRSMDELKQVLGSDYVDVRAGLLNGTMADLVSPFADAVVNLPMMGEDVGCAGRSHSYALSGSTAILEGLERYSGIQPRGKRTAVYGSYRDVADYALDPRSVGLHSPEQYALPGYPFFPVGPDEPMHWVWGYSFGQSRPIVVPESLAYYGVGCEGQFVFESSNGCALGGSLEEAILYGILEVAERDSFLMAWYAQLALPRLDLASANDPELQLMIDRLESVAGYEILFFNSTMEYGIPSVWGVARGRKPDGARLICAAGAHPDPVRAVKGAVHELAGMMANLDAKLASSRERCLRMLEDSSQVKSMEDHSLLYALPEAERRLSFLLEGERRRQTFDEAFARADGPPRADLKEELELLLERFRRCKLDVIVIDVTAPELRRNRLHCVKVLIPGTLPMTFGHDYTRLEGLDRLFRVPMELGFTKQRLSPEQINRYPHPFP